jgi:IS5 family transposase
MKQQTLAAAADQGAGFEQYRRASKRDVFLATMNEIVPWQALCEVIEPHYPKPGNGRPPVGLQRMLRMYFVQHWFNLADEACEEVLLDSTALRRFVGIDLGSERVPGRGRDGDCSPPPAQIRTCGTTAYGSCLES